MTEENNRQLAEMRNTVDEKLPKNARSTDRKIFFARSVRACSRSHVVWERCRTSRQRVGDLKKVLSNVKTRGIVGEIQLGAILQQILSPEQSEESIAVKGGSERVECAVKFPGEGDRPGVSAHRTSEFPGG